MEKIDKGLNWIDRTLAIVEKYKFKTIFKAIGVLLIVAAVAGFIMNPTWLFDQYKAWVDNQHDDDMLTREQVDIKVHGIVDKLNYRTNSSHVLVLEFHNGTESNGGLPFRKMSATYESVNVGIMPMADDYHEINLSLIPFANHIKSQGYWCGNIDDLEEIDRAFCYRLKSNGVEHFSACLIEGVDKPLAILMVLYDKDYITHECEGVRENTRHCALELALLLELNQRIVKK